MLKRGMSDRWLRGLCGSRSRYLALVAGGVLVTGAGLAYLHRSKRKTSQTPDAAPRLSSSASKAKEPAGIVEVVDIAKNGGKLKVGTGLVDDFPGDERLGKRQVAADTTVNEMSEATSAENEGEKMLLRAGQPIATSRRGIQNDGNSCYLNSSVQMLLAIDVRLKELVHSLKASCEKEHNGRTGKKEEREEGEEEVVIALSSVFESLELERGGKALDMSDLRAKVVRLARFRGDEYGREQQDASEVNALLLDAIGRVADRRKGKDDETGRIPSDLKFLQWGYEKHILCFCKKEHPVKNEVDLALNLPLIVKDKRTGELAGLDACIKQEINRASSPEVIEGYKCDNTRVRGEVGRYTKLKAPPDTAMVIMGRFSFIRELIPHGDPRVKVVGKVGFSVDELTYLPGHVDFPYLAVAVLRHIGVSLSEGHYTTLVRKAAERGSDWLLFDDGSVTTVPSRYVCGPSAYVVVYRRLNHLDATQFSSNLGHSSAGEDGCDEDTPPKRSRYHQRRHTGVPYPRTPSPSEGRDGRA